MLRYATWQVLQVYGCEAAPDAWTLAMIGSEEYAVYVSRSEL
jgi:hypothetical protein